MNSPDPLEPVAIPWYKSKILQGILTGIVAQIVARLQSVYHIDITVWGLDVPSLVQWLMDLITAGAIAYTTHARVTQKSAPAVVATKKQADDINKEAGK